MFEGWIGYIFGGLVIGVLARLIKDRKSVV